MMKAGSNKPRSRLSLGEIGQGGAEGARVRWLIFYLFCVVSASTVGRTAADTLFLSRFDASRLSMMYLPQAASLIFIGFLFQRYGSRIRLDRLLVLLIPVISGLVVLSRLGVAADLGWVYPVIYVGFDVFNFLMIVCFWQFASSVLDQRKAKKTIPLVGSGGIVGGILSGFGLKLLAPLIGTDNLLLLYAALQLLALVSVLLINRTVPNPADTYGSGAAGAKDKQAKNKLGKRSGLFENVPHLKYIAILSGALVISLTLIDYQFKVILRESLQNEALAGFMGSFYGFSGLCALLVQLFVAGKLLSRFGVMMSILVFPIALFAGSLGVLLAPALALALLVKGSDKVLGDTIYSSVNQLIMFPISPEWRNRAKSFLDGVIRNGAKGVAAVSLIVLSPLLSVREFSFVVLALVGIGIYAAIRVKGAYLRMLLSTLEARGTELPEAELDLMDPASRRLLAGALSSPDRQQALYALRTLSGLESFDLKPYLPALLRHPASEVAAEALRHIERATPDGMRQELRKLLAETPDDGVIAQGLIAIAAYAEESDLVLLTEKLDADKVEIRAGAIAGLIKYYGIEGMFRAVGTLKALIESGFEDERTAMASLFGRIGIREFYKPLIPMLQDSSAEVRRCALRSASELAVPELVPYIVPLLKESRTRRQAIEALAAYEDAIVLPLLEPYLAAAVSPASPHVPKAIERIGTQAAFDMLLRHYGTAGFDMRDRLLAAMTGMEREPLKVDANEVERLALIELEHYRLFADNLNWTTRRASDTELRDAAEQARASMMRRAFGLLGLIYDPMTIDAVYLGWLEGDARRQANAAEVMDQLLQGEVRTELTKWMLASRTAEASNGQTVKKEQLIWLYERGDEMLREAIRYSAIGAEADRTGRRGLPFIGVDDGDALRERMTRLQMLRQSSLFEGFKSKDLLPLVDYLQKIDVSQDQLLFREGDPGDSMFLVREGTAGIYRRDTLIDERGPGDHIGETAVLTRRLRTAMVRAKTDVSLLRLSSADFYEALFDRTELALEMMKRMSRKLREAMERQRQAEASGLTAQAHAEAAAAREATSDTASDNAADSPSEPSAEITNQVILRRVLILQKIELFAHLSQDDFVRLANRVEEVAYEPGETICRMDEHGDTMFGIIEGSIQVHRGAEKLAQLGVGQCFGEMAIIDSGPRSADCTAIERTVLLKLGRQQVISFVFQQIEALKGMMKVLADRLRELN
ncbi:Npt1/Npt2 family nucleotide transporter [Cohnella panacarvi]|uniref:Npt1/Npt2 family nucleotide transporter n=1 Tax=Cohnella panacarvi TaxID=400776 RepID=UPI00047C6325|nr:Npt1/Npt2 family nucleotide transporter [Cohnella panacarvi]